MTSQQLTKLMGRGIPTKRLLNITKLYRYFIGPIFKQLYFQQDASKADALNFLFGADQRIFRTYRVTKLIKRMPGKFKTNGTHKFDDLVGLRKYTAGWQVLAVYDKRTPHYLELELFKKWRDDVSYGFRLTPDEFRSIVDNLEEPLKRPKKRSKGV